MQRRRWTQNPAGELVKGLTVSQGSDEGWKQVTACARRNVPPPQNLRSRNGTFCTRCEALESGGPTIDEGGKGPTGIVGCPKTTLPVPLITTPSVKRKRTVLIGHSLLRGTEGLMCRPDTTHKEVSQGRKGTLLENSSAQLGPLITIHYRLFKLAVTK